MQRLKVKKSFPKEDFIKEYFTYFNKVVLKKPLSRKTLSVVIAIFNIKQKYSDVTSSEARKEVQKICKVSESNLVTYLKKIKDLKIIIPERGGYIFNPAFEIKSSTIEFTIALKLENVKVNKQ